MVSRATVMHMLEISSHKQRMCCLDLDMLHVFLIFLSRFLFLFPSKGDRVLLGGPGSFYWQGEIYHLSPKEVDLYDFSLYPPSHFDPHSSSCCQSLSVRKLIEMFLCP